LPKFLKVLSDHADLEFQVPLYNIWKWQEKTDTVNEIVSRISEDLPKSVKVLADHADPDSWSP